MSGPKTKTDADGRPGHNPRRLPLATDSVAFEAAVDVLGPYPWSSPAPALPSDVFPPRAWERLPEVVTRNDVGLAVKAIGEAYAAARANELNSVRLSDFAKKLRHIENASRSLALVLRTLDENERRVLGRSDQPGPVDSGSLTDSEDTEFGELYRALYDRIPPFYGPLHEGGLQDGDLVQELNGLARYVELIGKFLGTSLRDRGGRRRLFSRYRGSPGWHLAYMSWKLFLRVPHVKPSGSEGGPLHRFMLFVHEWVTEEVLENTEFLSTIKKFAGLMKVLAPLQERYREIRTTGAGYSQEDFDMAIRRPDLRLEIGIPQHVLAEADALLVQIRPLEAQLQHG